MIGFLIKKSFFDGWDNLLTLVLLNLGYLVAFGLVLLASTVSEISLVLWLAIVILALFYISIYNLGVNAQTYAYSRYKREGFKYFFKAIKERFTHALLYFVFVIALAVCIAYVIPFYFKMESLLGYFLGMILFWAIFAFLLAMQYYFPLCFYCEADSPLTTLRKSFGLVADNLGTTFFLLLKTLIDLAITILTATLIPGFGGISLARMDTVKLLMKKYEFYSKNPGSTKKDLNWEDLLYEERELVGPRSLKGMIFPWKD